MKAFGEHCDIQIAIDYEMKFILFLFLIELCSTRSGFVFILL